MARAWTGSEWVLAVVVAVALAGVWWLLWPGGDAQPQFRAAEAVVVQPAVCGSADRTQDVVRLELDGRPVIALLDGCGHRAGAVLPVEVATTDPTGAPVVRLAGTGVAPESTTRRRVAAVLAAVAGAAGALLAWRLRGRSLPPVRRGRHAQ